jgi:nitrilase
MSDLGGESIRIAGLDRDDIARGKCNFDVVRHYPRPDAFRFHINEAAQSAVALSSKG